MNVVADPPGEAASPEALEGEFRSAMRRHAAGVCIITSGLGEAVNGMAATAMTSFSLDPPSILVCVNNGVSIAGALTHGAAFGVSILGRSHEPIVAAFSRKPNGRPRFDNGDWRLEDGRVPWLQDAPANLSCVVAASLVFGSHTALVGRVTGVRLGEDGASLVYRDGLYL